MASPLGSELFSWKQPGKSNLYQKQKKFIEGLGGKCDIIHIEEENNRRIL